MGRAEAVAGIVVGAVLWYIAMACLVLTGVLAGLTGHGISGVFVNAWLYFGSLLVFMTIGIYVFDESSRKETKNVLKWLAGGILLWGLVLILLILLSAKININRDQAYNISLLMGCLILFVVLAIRSFRMKVRSHEF